MTSTCLRVLPRVHLICVLALLTFASACSSAAPPAHVAASEAAITIHDAWVRQPPPGASVAGAYVHLSNPGSTDDRLLAVDSTVAERVEIHDMQVVSGMMQMRPLEHGLALPAGETVALAPGGLHLMLIAPTQELVIGDEIEMTLTFAHAPAQTVMFGVRSLMDAGEEAPAHDHAGHHGH